MTTQKKTRMAEPAGTDEDGYLNASALTEQTLDEKDFTLEGLGKLRIRALSRALAIRIQEQTTNLDRERLALRYGVVVPELNTEQVKVWQENASAGALEPLTNAILELSGMLPSSEKEAFKRFPDEE